MINFSNISLKFTLLTTGKPSAFSKEQIDILQEWFFDNIENPYPSTEQKQFLSELTGLTVKQIQRWFGNRRKRFL